MRDVFAYSSLLYPATTWDAVADGMALRERIMQRHVGRVLDRARDEGAVLMAHNLHLAKDDARRGGRIKSPGVGPGGRKEPSLGSWVNERLGGQVLSVWMLFERGLDNQPFPSLPTELSSPPDSLNAVLGEVGECFALPTRSPDKRAKVLSEKADVVMLFSQASRLAVAEQADVVFFVRGVSPLTVDS
jgi:erythromycin esterase-like protein